MAAPTYASVGHLYAFDNTEERYRLAILGCRAKGHRGGRLFDPSTSRGWVKKQKGKYHDALTKHARVTPLIVETTGAISDRSLRLVAHLAHRAKGKHARDGTVYGRSRTSARSFFVHHTQRISMAAAYGDVKGIHESVRGLKQRAAAGRLGHAARA